MKKFLKYLAIFGGIALCFVLVMIVAVVFFVRGLVNVAEESVKQTSEKFKEAQKASVSVSTKPAERAILELSGAYSEVMSKTVLDAHQTWSDSVIQTRDAQLNELHRRKDQGFPGHRSDHDQGFPGYSKNQGFPGHR